MYKRRLLVKKTITENKKILVEKLKQLQIKLLDEESSIREEIEAEEKKAGEFKNPEIKVLDAIYPGVKIVIHDQQMSIEEPLQYVYFKYSEQGIIATDLSEQK